jgi:hypothetical protein
MNLIEKLKYKKEFIKATKMNRHDRRALAKINKIKKIPSIVNVKFK